MDEFYDCSSDVDEWEKVTDEMRHTRDFIVCAMLEMSNGHKLVSNIPSYLIEEQ